MISSTMKSSVKSTHKRIPGKELNFGLEIFSSNGNKLFPSGSSKSMLKLGDTFAP